MRAVDKVKRSVRATKLVMQDPELSADEKRDLAVKFSKDAGFDSPGEMAQFAGELSDAGTMPDWLAALAQGASFGFSDEIAAGIQSAVTDTSYEDAVAAHRQQNEAFKGQSPVLAHGLEIAGGFAVPGGVAARAVRGGTGALSTIARGGLLGAGTGAGSAAAYEVGTGEGSLSERVDDVNPMVVGAGGLLGAGVGGGLPIADNAARYAGRMLTGGNRPVRETASRIIGRNLDGNQPAVPQGGLLADATPSLREEAGVAFRRSRGEQRDNVVGLLETRAATRPERIQTGARDEAGNLVQPGIRNLLGVFREPAPLAQRTSVAMRDASEGAYAALDGVSVNVGDDLAGILSRPGISQQYNQVRRGLASQGRGLPKLDELAGSDVDARDLQAVYSHLGDLARNTSSGRNTQQNRALGKGLTQAQGALRETLDGATDGAFSRANERFAAGARAVGGEQGAVGGALAKGTAAAKSTVSTSSFRSQYEALSEGERRFFRNGYVNELLNTMQNSSRPTTLRKLLSGREGVEGKLRVLYPRLRRRDQLVSMLEAEQQKLATEQTILGGSPTATRQAADEAFAQETEAIAGGGLLGDAATGNVIGFFQRAREALRHRYNERTANELLRMLTETDAATQQRIIRAALSARDDTMALNQARIAAGAAAGGGAGVAAGGLLGVGP